jgi:hypothetical protein
MDRIGAQAAATISGRALGNAVTTKGEIITGTANVIAAFVFACRGAAGVGQAPPTELSAQVPANLGLYGRHLCIYSDGVGN